MAPVPKKKHTRSRSNMRRNVVKLDVSNMTKCPSCGKIRFSHKACGNCGYRYNQ